MKWSIFHVECEAKQIHNSYIKVISMLEIRQLKNSANCCVFFNYLIIPMDRRDATCKL